MSMPPAASTAPRRRNGRQQACEPCRRRKMACDHTLPTCMRCKRRKAPEQCIYLEAPASRRSVGAVTGVSASPLRREMPAVISPPSSATSIGYGSLATAATATASRPGSLFSDSSSFFGPTSFSAVFQENRTHLEVGGVDDNPLGDGEAEPSATETQRQGLGATLIQVAVSVLAKLPSEKACHILFARHANPNDGWIQLAGEHLCRSVWSTFGTALTEKRKEDLEELAELLSRNSSTVLHDEDDPQRWLDSFSDRNLRWEALGVLFTYFAFGAIASPENDELLVREGVNMDRREYMIELKECASACISLATRTGLANTLTLYLLYKHNILQSLISGDASLILWRQHSDLVAVTIALGLHQGVENLSATTALTAEIKRRLHASVFNIDKVLATFMGRPPLLSRRYTSTPLPLDLSDEVLLSDASTLAGATASLSPTGWNTDHQIYSTTVLRARTMFAYIRDGILELALGSMVENPVESAKDLKRRSEAIYSQLPAVLIYRAEDLSDSHTSGPAVYKKILTRLEYLQNILLLDRLLIKHGYAAKEELLRTSAQMLSLTLVLWTHRDRLAGLHSDFEWFIMSYGVPPSGILCVELLRQVKSPSEQPTIPRSEIIQNLSMFVGFLDWVKPSAPNADLCFRVKKIIKHILNRVLDQQPAIPTEQQSTTPDSLYLSLPDNLPEFENFTNFDLMDTFDWLN